jgi:hypothetical protein
MYIKARTFEIFCNMLPLPPFFFARFPTTCLPMYHMYVRVCECVYMLPPPFFPSPSAEYMQTYIIYVCMYARICKYVCMNIHIYVCAYILHIYICMGGLIRT